ncbi:hypothetical protein Scep_015226 [Stephania cephalantha]|uniref:Uncharacterized protein n=1 Tax=Stephania cephalantha TaxID=152367 RepID=A0AAP0J3L4_9MAGN
MERERETRERDGESGEVEGARAKNSSEIGAGQRAAARRRRRDNDQQDSKKKQQRRPAAGVLAVGDAEAARKWRGRGRRRRAADCHEDAGEERRCLNCSDAGSKQHGSCASERRCKDAGEERQRRDNDKMAAARRAGTAWSNGAVARCRPIDPRRDNNGGQGIVTSTKLDDAIDSNGF